MEKSAKYPQLDLKSIMSKKIKIITSSEALKDVQRFNYDQETIKRKKTEK